ncbi:MAG: ATP-binding protein [Cyclobacteriaceae bacterium]
MRFLFSEHIFNPLAESVSGLLFDYHVTAILLAANENTFLRWEVILSLVLFILFVSLGSYGLGMNIRDKHKKELERQVRERTEELEKANYELQQRNSELDRFVYSASHDLSAPLKSILGLINVARLENPQSEMVKYLEMMEGSVVKLESFIDEVIQYSRNSRVPVQNEEIDFKRLISDILNDYRYAPNFDKINFKIECRDDMKMISDPMRLKIILNNLISNAIKFHRFGNGVRPEVVISAKIEGDNYRIAVQDNGRGIRSEYVEKIFEMFFRATEEVAGSGLGLYILKETVSRLNGTIEVKSELEVGTLFTVLIPIPT